MALGSPSGLFIGCATDPAFVEMTTAMLSSLDDNGGLSDAVVVVGDFGLSFADQAVLRESAGALGRSMQFIRIEPRSEKIVALPCFDFPLPLLGRLILPSEVLRAGSRMLLLDSDMIINRSLRPLVKVDLRSLPIAAVEDVFAIRYCGRQNYFNAGMMLLDLEEFNKRQIGSAAMHWLAGQEHKPDMVEQDALNAVVAGEWLRLDRKWNYFHAGDDRHFTYQDYCDAFIVHYAGRKPWEDHVAGGLYWDHLERCAAKTRRMRRAVHGNVDRHFIASCYEVLLGRELESRAALAERVGFSTTRFVESVVISDEFQADVYEPMAQSGALLPGRFGERLSLRHRFWAVDHLPVLGGTAERILSAGDWQGLIRALLSDPQIMSLSGLPVID